MFNSICTIITIDYLPYALALRESFKRNVNHSLISFVFISDFKKNNVTVPDDDTVLLYVDDLCNEGIGKQIYDKYYSTNMDNFRWSMKPVLLNYILNERGCEKVIYADCDIHFYNSCEFLFDLLGQNHILLSPHFRSSNFRLDRENYILQFTEGIYNGGFIGVNKKATPAMHWWAERCLDICEKKASIGQYVDQTHLNLLPVFFDHVYVLKHRGCNVANWNQLECKRVEKEDGTVLINGHLPIVFIHFTASTIEGIVNGSDCLLMPYLKIYSDTQKKYNPKLDLINYVSMGKNGVIIKKTIKQSFILKLKSLLS